MASILIVDDHPLSRDGTAVALRELDPRHDVRQAGSLAECFEMALAVDIDLVLLDLDLGSTRGTQTLQSLKAWLDDHEQSPRILVLSATPDPELVRASLETYASGFVSKAASREIFKEAVNRTLAGGLFIPATLLPVPARSETAAPDTATILERLTPREKEVAALLIRGLTYKQIAKRLKAGGKAISEQTVRAHVGNMAWKMGVTENAKAGVMSTMALLGLTFDCQR